MNIISPTFIMLDAPDESEVLSKIERIARVCYKSEASISEGSAERLVQRLIDSGHEAMIEHYSISVLVTTDRGVTHEAVRHRVASYAMESTRYCNYTNEKKFSSGITYIDLFDSMRLDPKVVKLPMQDFAAIYSEWYQACEDAERHYNKMLSLGATPQIARSVLNHSTKSEIVITMNFREWRHFFRLRTAKDAHPAMREIAIPMFRAFKEKYPVLFSDMEDVNV